MSKQSIREAAAKMHEAMTVKSRPDGSTFHTLKDGSPKWMRDVCFAAHNEGGIPPDDYRYRFIAECLEAIVESDDDPSDAVRAIEPDVYTSDLTAWLASSVRRVNYMDEAMAIGLREDFSGSDLLMAAQQCEIWEVGDAVIAALEGIEDAEDDEDDTDDDDEDDIACPECGEARFRAEDGGLTCPNGCEQTDD